MLAKHKVGSSTLLTRSIFKPPATGAFLFPTIVDRQTASGLKQAFESDANKHLESQPDAGDWKPERIGSNQ